MGRHDLKLGSREIQSALVESPNSGEHLKLDDRVQSLGVRQVATSTLHYAPLLTVPLPQDKVESFQSRRIGLQPEVKPELIKCQTWR